MKYFLEKYFYLFSKRSHIPMWSFRSTSKYILQLPCVFITPPSSFSLSKFSTTQNSKNTKRRILQILNINLCSKSIQSLSSCQPSPQEFEVRYLGFNFGSAPPYSTYHLIHKSTACLT